MIVVDGVSAISSKTVIVVMGTPFAFVGNGVYSEVSPENVNVGVAYLVNVDVMFVRLFTLKMMVAVGANVMGEIVSHERSETPRK